MFTDVEFFNSTAFMMVKISIIYHGLTILNQI